MKEYYNFELYDYTLLLTLKSYHIYGYDNMSSRETNIRYANMRKMGEDRKCKMHETSYESEGGEKCNIHVQKSL